MYATFFALRLALLMLYAYRFLTLNMAMLSLVFSLILEVATSRLVRHRALSKK